VYTYHDEEEDVHKGIHLANGSTETDMSCVVLKRKARHVLKVVTQLTVKTIIRRRVTYKHLLLYSVPAH